MGAEHLTEGGDELFTVDQDDTVRLTVSRCTRCARLWFPARPVCGACGSMQVEIDQAGPDGEVYASTMVRNGPSGYETPYCLAYLDIGPLRVLAPFHDGDEVPDSPPAIGTPVRLGIGRIPGPGTQTYVARRRESGQHDA